MKLNHDNRRWKLDIETAISLGVLIPDTTHKVGNHYQKGNCVYILASAGEVNHVVLVNTTNGWTTTSVLKVNNWDNLTDNEWNRVGGADFSLINP